jgi:hypothetical protein
VWEFVRSHAATFGRPLTAGDGTEPADLDEAADRLGCALPVTLREAYRLFGQRPDLTRSQNRLLKPYQLRIDPSGSVLVFRDECQGCTSWGVRLAELDLDDPPVVMELGDTWMPYSVRLSLALAEMVLFESMFSEPDERAVDNRDLDDVALGQLEAGFTRLGLPDLPMAGPGGPRVRWFQAPDVLLRDDGETWLWVHGRGSAAVEAVRERLPGDWQMVEVDNGEQDSS